MSYKVVLTQPVVKQLKKIEVETERRIRRRLHELESNPRPVGVEKLAGEQAFYRVRVGDWRIVYQIIDKTLIVLVLKVGHRREIYRAL